MDPQHTVWYMGSEAEYCAFPLCRELESYGDPMQGKSYKDSWASVQCLSVTIMHVGSWAMRLCLGPFPPSQSGS